MSRTEHTPGPWRIDDAKVYPAYVPNGAAKDCRVCTVSFAAGLEAEANARLIAAAPRMLQALRLALDCWEYQAKATGEKRPGWVQSIADALEEATGGAQ